MTQGIVSDGTPSAADKREQAGCDVAGRDEWRTGSVVPDLAKTVGPVDLFRRKLRERSRVVVVDDGEASILSQAEPGATDMVPGSARQPAVTARAHLQTRQLKAWQLPTLVK
jgi:hypothetical protein